MDALNQRHYSWLHVTCDTAETRVWGHGPDSGAAARGSDAGALLPSAERLGDSPAGAPASAGRAGALTTLACSGLLEPLRLWWLRCLLLRGGLGLWEPAFASTTVPSSSELKSELSDELRSGPTVGSWIWSGGGCRGGVDGGGESCNQDTGEKLATTAANGGTMMIT